MVHNGKQIRLLELFSGMIREYPEVGRVILPSFNLTEIFLDVL